MSSDSDSSSEYEFGKVALAYDPDQLSGGDGPPNNGHDYLRLVQLERATLPTCTQAKRPKNVDQSATASGKSQLVDNDDDLLFRDEIIENFLKLRNYIHGIRNNDNDNTINIEPANISNQTRLVIRMSEPELHSALDEIIDGDKTFDSEWVYSLLAALREPIDAETCNSIRQIARLCQTLRKTNARDLGSMLIICIVRNHFDQRDIKMN